MGGMFSGAKAFNQPVNFDTAKVTEVRVFVLNSSSPMNDEEVLIIFIQPYYNRCLTYSVVLRPSINQYLLILLRLKM